MSRTDHHRRVRQLRDGNPARLLVDERTAVRKGILKSSARSPLGYPDWARGVTVWAKPGVRKAFQTAAHRRDRKAVREALATTAYGRDPARRQALRFERALIPVPRRSVNEDMTD
ncbi:hypothetical protein [Streptomyces sp. NPDC051572]|jgi:hypothetical protein|uniref:hypothetical protein n=1 Tax=Streptomyces sp. NPDC051572 TaxID=3155802 RepID=UPI00344E3E2F